MDVSSSFVVSTPRVNEMLSAITNMNSTHCLSLLDSLPRLPKDIPWLQNFKVDPGVTPLCHWSAPLITVCLYLTIIWACKQVVRARGKPFDLKWAVLGYNALMAVVAASMLYLMVIEVAEKMLLHGFWSFFCDPEPSIHTVGRIWFLYWLHYALKFWELSDTFLIALRGRPTTFLHVYHHAAVVVLGWNQLSTKPCMQWVAHMLNLSVHVVLFTYFTLHALGFRPWFKRCLTAFQVTQFIIIAVAGLTALTPRVIFTIDPTLPGAYPCMGSWAGTFFGLAIIFSYLYLFGKFYLDTYNKKPAQSRKQLLTGKCE